MLPEDDDFIPNPSTNSRKLASLFERSDVSSGGNSSLMYKAPKQPRPQKQHHSPKVNSEEVKCLFPSNDSNLVTLVKTVQTFKLENNEYVSRGKAGAAILVNSQYSLYQLILYKEKSDIMAQAVLNSQFWFTVQPNNYTSFYDKHKVLWSILFESSESAIEFITHITIAKWSCEGRKKIAVQELVVMKNEKSVENDSFVDISYAVQILLPDNKLDKKIDYVESEQIHISSNSDPSGQSWQSELIGMTVGSKRLIMLPGSHSGKWMKFLPDVNKNYSILLTVSLNRIEPKILDEKSSNLDSSVEQNVKSKSESIKDALSISPNSSRASLISRMAKMGQPTLPFKGARVATSGISDSSETEEDVLSVSSSDGMVKSRNRSYRKSQDSQLPGQPITQLPNVILQHSVPPVVSVPSTGYNQQTVVNSESGASAMAISRSFTSYDRNFMQPGTFTSPNFNTNSDPQLSVFLSELRTHNTELRMNINRVSDKIDRVVDKVDNIDPSKLLDELHLLERNILSQLSLASQRSNEVNSAIMMSGAKLTALSSSSESSNQYEQVKKENLDLVTALSHAKIELKELEMKLEQLEILNLDLKLRLGKEKESKSLLEKEHILLTEKLKNQLSNQEKRVESWHALAERTASTIVHLERKIKEKQKITLNDNKDDIKKLMRSVFMRLLERFPHNSTAYSSSEIHSTLAEVIKAFTLEYLQSKTIATNNNTIDKLQSVPISQKITSSTVTQHIDRPKTHPFVENVNWNLKEKLSDAKESREIQGDLINDKFAERNEGVDPHREQGAEKIITVTHNIADSSTSILNAPELIKVKDEIVKSLENNLQKAINDIIKEDSTNDSNLAESRDLRDQSPCSSARSDPTNDTVDEVWRSQPPPLSFDDEEKDTDDDWLKM